MISSFCYEVDENCALLGYCAVSTGNSKKPTILGFLTLVDGTNRLSRNIGKVLLWSLHNSPEEHISQLQIKLKEIKLNRYIMQIIFVIFVSPFCCLLGS